jgi:O-antigen ligase
LFLLVTLAACTILSFIFFFLKNNFSAASYLLFIVYVLPLMNLGVTTESLGSFTVFDLLSFFIFILYFKDFLLIYKANRIYFYSLWLLLFIFFLGAITSHFVNHSLLSILNFIPIFFFSKLLIKELANDSTFKFKIIDGLKFSFFIASIFILFQIIFGPQATFYVELHSNTFSSEGNRYPGFFYDSQMNAQFLGMISFIFLINRKDVSKPSPKNIVYFTIASIFVFLSGGRSGLFGFSLGLLFLLLFSNWQLKKIISIAIFCSLFFLPFMKDSLTIFKRLNDIDDSYQFRTNIWNNAIKIFEKNKFLGIGIGNYKNYVTAYSPDQYLILENNEILILDQPENGYLKLLTELGIFGFITFFLLLIIPIAKVFYSHFAEAKNYLLFIIIASIICWFVSFNSLYTLSDKRIAIVLTSLLCLLINVKNENSVNEV